MSAASLLARFLLVSDILESYIGGLPCNIDVPLRSFDLVIANASVMLNDHTLEWKDRVHLVYAQLMVAFRYIAPGGSLVISLQVGPFAYIVDTLQVLRQCFQTITAVKPNYQKRRSIAYVVCHGYIASDGMQGSFLNRLELGIKYLTRTGKTTICYTSQR